MALKNPILSNPIAVDIPKLNEILDALSKANPTDVDGISTGAMRLYEVSSGKWQWQEYNGSSWAAVPFLQHNVDQLDGYHAAITPAANTVAVRNASGLLQDSITGNAATSTSAATLSQTLPVNKGGTGATTSEAARANLGVPPTSHASTATTYGAGNATQYGHIKLSDAVDSASGATGGTAATPAAVKAAKDAADAAQSSADAAQSSADAAQSSADAAQSSADAAMTKASTLATASAAGIVKPGTGMTVDAAGALNVNTASTGNAGIVRLNNTVTSTSTTQSATANAVKTAYDKGVEAKESANNAQKTADIPGKFLGSRKTTGNWTLTGCVVNRPIFLVLSGSGNSAAYFEVVSGAHQADTICGMNIGADAIVPNIISVIATATTVVVNMTRINENPTIYAYQG